MECSRTVLDTRFNDSNASLGCQGIIRSGTRLRPVQEKTPGSWSPMMGWGHNGVSIYPKGKPSPEKDGGFAAEARAMEEKHKVSPSSPLDIPVLENLSNGVIDRQSPLFGKYESEFKAVRGSQDCNGNLMKKGIPNIRFFPHDQFQENCIPPEENYLLMRAKTQSGSEELVNLIGKGNHCGIQIMLEGVLGSMFEWMTDEYAHHVFGMLVEKSQYDQLRLIVNRAAIEPDRFADVALTHKGSKSIKKIIRSIKKNLSMEISITRILRPRSYELLTHKISADVVRQCFHQFGETSLVLFLETLSQRLLDLAVDKVGCVSLYTLIDCITGGYRQLVLEHLADQSLFLTNDPVGHFIVQHLLELNNKEVTKIIINRLEGNFEHLAQKQGGSHVTEKCMSHSPRALEIVISDITKNRNTLLRVAQDQFGNYVIQRALKLSKMLSDRKLYMQLLDALKPNYSFLMGRSKGRHVAELMKDDLESVVEAN